MMQTSLPTLPQKITPFMRAVFCFLCIIISRLCYLQIKQWHYFKERSTKNFLRTERIPSLRGNIVDAHGTILATNRPVVDIVWHGTSNATLTTEQEKIDFLFDCRVDTKLECLIKIEQTCMDTRLRVYFAIIFHTKMDIGCVNKTNHNSSGVVSS